MASKGSRDAFLNLVLVEGLKELRVAHPFWGYRRMTAGLKFREGYVVNHKRIQKLIQENGLGVERKKMKALRTSSRPKPRATLPNQYWGIEMPKFMLGTLGWCYLIIVLDWFIKEIVGWNVSLRARTKDWKVALDSALCVKVYFGVRSKGLNLISDNGS